MSSAQHQRQLEELLREAVREFAASTSSSRHVVADMSGLIQTTSTLPLAQLSRWEELTRIEFSQALRASSVSRATGWRALFRPAHPTTSKRILTWVDLNNFDGHVRERALRTFAGPVPNAFFFAMATRRLNDWVPQVRMAARETIPELARASDPQHVASALCALLPSWRSWGRIEMLDRKVMVNLVAVKGVAESLKRRLIDSAAGPMALVLSQAMQGPSLDEFLTEIASKALQPAVRARAYRALLLGKAVWVEGRRWQWTDIRYCKGRYEKVFGERPMDTPPTLGSLMAAATDRSCIVRGVAAEALIREMDRLGDAVLSLARRFADDASPAVAERGRFVLQNLRK